LAHPARLRAAALVGLLAGMAPDLDVLIRSSEDPLLFLEYHRQFTHSLFFIPLGAAIVAMLCHWLFARRWQLPFRLTLAFALLGYATHALLDACTSYGTLLLWPFSDKRFSWDTVSVIDPLVSLPLILLVLAAAKWRRRSLAALAVAWVLGYQFLGYAQQQRALDAAQQLALQRGHSPGDVIARPGFGNILLWRTLYLHEGRYYADGVFAGRRLRLYAGESIPALDTRRDFPWLDPASQQALDITRFHWFSQGYTAVSREAPDRIIDVRYAMLPTGVEGLWGIQLQRSAAPTAHAAYVVSRELPPGVLARFWLMLRGKG
ncbi:MAG: metal-dependent hydrolase, partial [Pseudomonadales bacterium]